MITVVEHVFLSNDGLLLTFLVSHNPFSSKWSELNKCRSDVALLPDLSSYFGEYKVVIADKKDGQCYNNKTQIVIKQID